MKRTVLTSILASLLVASSIGQTAGQSKPATTTPKPVPASTTPVTTTSTTPAAPAPSDTTSTQTTKKAKLITNVFTDADIKTVIQEIASAVGQSIIADTSVKGTDINIEFKKDTAESALEKLSYAAGLLWKKKGDLYLVSTGMPDAPLFSEFAETKVYTPHTQPAENLYGLLTRSFTAYAQLDKAANMIEVTAPPKQMEAVWKALTAADSPRKQFCDGHRDKQPGYQDSRLFLELAILRPGRRSISHLCDCDRRRHRKPQVTHYPEQG